jgi:hypothetical protein
MRLHLRQRRHPEAPQADSWRVRFDEVDGQAQEEEQGPEGDGQEGEEGQEEEQEQEEERQEEEAVQARPHLRALTCRRGHREARALRVRRGLALPSES